MMFKAILTSLVLLLLSAKTCGADKNIITAQELFENKKYEVAEEEFNKVLINNSNNSVALYCLARISHQREDFKQAEQMFDKSL
jgi:Flp pilus assembly protein TadD